MRIGCRLDMMRLCLTATAGGAKALVMDAELVAVDRANDNRLRAFQELSTRARGQVTSHEVGPHCGAQMWCNITLTARHMANHR